MGEHFKPNGSPCCGNEAWRGRLCSYHQGVEDGAETALEILRGIGKRLRDDWLPKPDAMLQWRWMRQRSDGYSYEVEWLTKAEATALGVDTRRSALRSAREEDTEPAATQTGEADHG